MAFEAKAVWITGASSGIGEALAIAFARKGARVILSARRKDVLEKVAIACRGESLVLPFDATDLDALPAAVEKAWSWSGGVDVLINNAGVSQRSPAVETDFKVYRQIMEVDFFGPARLTQLVLARMIERKSGHLVAIASLAGKFGVPLRTGYCAAKHALVGFYDAMRAEVAEQGIQVSVVTPGFIRTSIAANAILGDGNARGGTDPNIESGMSAEECADAIVRGLADGKREFAVGKARDLAALALKRVWPDKLMDVMASQAKKLA